MFARGNASSRSTPAPVVSSVGTSTEKKPRSVTINSETSSSNLDTEQFLQNLDPEQKQSLLNITNQVLDTLATYLEDVNAAALSSENICVFAHESTPFTYSVVENPSMVLGMHTSGAMKIVSSIYLNSLNTYSDAQEMPTKRKSIVALASECALLLLTGRNDIVELSRDLGPSIFKEAKIAPD
jgi:hypothetical protein